MEWLSCKINTDEIVYLSQVEELFEDQDTASQTNGKSEDNQVTYFFFLGNSVAFEHP